jgi:hypothetical protein
MKEHWNSAKTSQARAEKKKKPKSAKLPEIPADDLSS